MTHSSAEGARGAPVRRVFKWLGVVCLGVAVVLVLVLGGLHTPSGRRFVLSRVTGLLAARQIDFNADQLRYNLFDLSVDLRDVTVRSARSADDPPFAVIGRLTADLSLVDLLRGRYVVESATAERARIHYLVDSLGDNLPRPPRDPNAPDEPVDYLIASLTVTGAHLEYDNRVQQVTARLPVESLTVTGDRATDRHEVSLAAGGGRLLAEGRDVRLETLAAQLDLGDDDMNIARAVLEAEGSRVEVSGTVERFADPTLDTRVQAVLDLARASRLAGLDERAAGQVTVNATARGLASAPDIEARVQGRRLAFRDLEDLSLDTEVAYDGQARRVNAGQLDATAPWGQLSGNGQVSFEQGPSRATLRATGLDLATLMRGLGLESVVASRLDADADLQWAALDYAAATGTADLTLRPTRARATRSTLPVGGRVSVEGQGRRLVARLNGVAAAGARLDGRVTLADRQRLGGTIRAAIADVGATAAHAEALTGRPTGSLLSDRIAGRLDAHAALGGTLSRPTADAAIEAPALDIEQADRLSLASRLRYTPETLTLTTTDVVWGQARAHAAGRIGLESGQPLDLRFEVDALQLPALLALAGRDPSEAQGTVNANGHATGTLTSPAMAATISGSALAAGGEPLGELAADVGLTGRQVTVSRLVLDKPQPGGDGQLTATGGYNLDTRAYTYDLRTSNLQLTSVVLPDGRPVSGSVALEGQGEGTIASPAGSLRVGLSDVRLADHDLGAIQVNAVAADARAEVDLSAERFGLRSTAVIDLTPSYPATVDARIDGLDLARLPIDLQTPLTGRLSANATSSLELARPGLARVNATIVAFEGSWNQQPFALDGPAVFALADERVTIDRLTLTAQDSTMSVRGTLPTSRKGGDGDLTIDARANLATLARYAPADASVTANGSLQLSGTIRGNLEFVDPDVQLSIDNGAFTTPQLGPGVTNLTARARVAGGLATLEQLHANWSAATIEASGTVPLDLAPALPVEIPRRGGPASFRAAIVGLDPATLPGAPEGISGRISVNVNGDAARPDLAALDAALTFPELRVSIRDLDLAQQQPSTVRVAGGQAAIERFSLSGSAGTLSAAGTVGLTGERPIDVRVDGDFNTAAAASFTDAVRTEGRATLDVSATGTVGDPVLAGVVALTDVNVVLDEPRIVAEDLDARIDLAGNRLTVTSLTADVNGGTLTGSGGLAYRDGALRDVDVRLAARDIAFDAPLDLRSLSDSTVSVTTRDDDLLVSGKVVIREAGLTGDINFDTGLLATLDQPRALDLTEQRNPLLEQINFNVQVVTASPILVDNNLARAEVRTNLRVLGTPYETGLTGTMTVLEGGEITLNERRYEVERAAITFLEERRIVPSFDLRLNTTAGSYDVILAVSGEPGNTETTLTSDPTLPEPDIMALLVTGRTLDQMRGEEGDIAKEQVLSYVAGRVGSQLGRGLEQATGLSEVRLEPNLIANETDPSARLTVAQDLTDDLTLVYSTDLADSNDQVWVARYDVTRRFQTNAVRQADSSYRLDFRHDVRFGGRPSPRRTPRQRPEVALVNVTPDGVLGEAELRDRIGFEPGDTFDYFAARDRIEDIEAELQKRGRLQARVRLDREQDGNSLALNLRVEAGPLVEIAYEGVQPPSDVDEEVRRQWNRGVFDSQRAGDAGDALREWLIADRHLTAQVEHRVDDSAQGARRVVFAITPGTRFERIEMEFAGASAVEPATLDEIVDEQDLELQLFTDPVVVTELLERYYREEGYLSAEIDEPTYVYEGAVARAVLQVREGPRFAIRDVTVAGNSVIPTADLLRELPVAAGDPFLPRAAQAALERTRQLYWQRAYNDMRSEYSLVIDRQAGRVDVAFEIAEGRQSVIAGLDVKGNRKTSDRLVAEQLEIGAGQPLDLSALGRSRRNLYDTGAFSMVDITREPVGAAAGTVAGDAPASDGATGSNDDDVAEAQASAAEPDGVKPVRVNVNLREVQPLQLRYGASYDTERGLGGILDVSNHNSLGKARVLGLVARYDGSVREGRIYLNQPSLLYWPVATTASVYYREERNAETAVADPFNVDRFGVSIQQERELANAYVWTYGYRYERARKFDALAGMRGETTTVSPLTSTFTREARDEVLDATRGSFTSHGFSYSPSWLGGDASYVKYFGQYFHYFPLQPERRKRFTNEILRPRFVYATGIRLGLAHGFGGQVPETERFYAGGSTSLRGFEQNAVGPIGVDRIPTGGEALLVLNNEVRFPLVGIVDGVGFLDVGNVFDRISDFDFSDIRETAGIGVRLRTPWFLVRGDYGVVLDQRPGERRSRFYFSIGQAF